MDEYQIQDLWKRIKKNNFTDWRKLLDFLELSLEERRQRVLRSASFPLNLPKRLAEKICKGDWEDPILKQFLPVQEELQTHPLFKMDPVDDQAACQTPKLLQKYRGRALLMPTSACAMHCRFCFRKNFNYQTEEKSVAKELEWIAQDPSLSEIILSGGDPLSLADEQLQVILEGLASIPHVKRVRFHTRFPIGIPERITPSFLSLLGSSPQQIFFVIHCNHLKEFDETIWERLKQIQRLGIPLLSHSVLLRGVNDQLSTLKELFESLADHGIIPYYLNQLDRVQGSAHFEVPKNEGLELMAQLAKQLSGYALPRYVEEIAHHSHKLPIQKEGNLHDEHHFYTQSDSKVGMSAQPKPTFESRGVSPSLNHIPS